MSPAFFTEPKIPSRLVRLSLRLPRLAAHGKLLQERLEREFGLNLITTAPSVRYRITRTDGTVMEVDSPAKFPTPSDISKIEEPIIKAMIITTMTRSAAFCSFAGQTRHRKKGSSICRRHA